MSPGSHGKKAGLAIFSSILALSAGEVVFRVGRFDERSLIHSLYYQHADLSVHRPSEDGFLHYELKPGSHYSGQHDNAKYAVNIGDSGARMPGHAPGKPPGTFRILCFGGSTMYGANVDDDETIPAAMEARLSGDGGGRRTYEAWNFGTSAYTLGQAAHLARTRLRSLHPDLILIQVFNTGRRPFLQGDSEDRLAAFIFGDPDFFTEQFPGPAWIPTPGHRFAAHHSALYRAVLGFTRRNEDNDFGASSAISNTETMALLQEADAQHVPIVFVSIPANHGLGGDLTRETAKGRLIDLDRPGRENEFYAVHPPPRILREWASTIIEELRSRSLLPQRGSQPDVGAKDVRSGPAPR